MDAAVLKNFNGVKTRHKLQPITAIRHLALAVVRTQLLAIPMVHWSVGHNLKCKNNADLYCIGGNTKPHVAHSWYRACSRRQQQPAAHHLPAFHSTSAFPVQSILLNRTVSLTAAQSVSANAPQQAVHSTSQDWHKLVLDSCLKYDHLVRVLLKAKINTKGIEAPTHFSDNHPGSGSMVSFSQVAAAKGQMPYKQLSLRPVMLKGRLQLQLSLLDARQDTTKNFIPEQAVQQLQSLLQLPWQSASIQTVHQTTNIQISKKGKVLIQSSRPAAAAAPLPAPDSSSSSSNSSSSNGTAVGVNNSSSLSSIQQQQLQSLSGAVGPISLQHDRVKAAPINGSVPDPFLQKIGLQTSDGRIKANMQAKFTQINEFIKLLIHTGELEYLVQQQQQQQQNGAAAAAGGGDTLLRSSSSSSSGDSGGDSSGSTVYILDCGCGSSHLTFGTYHYLANILSLPVQLTGVDTNKALMDRSNRYCNDLGISDQARFVTAAIRDYQPQQQPAIVLALHACDTATDEALALGIRSGADVIMSVPCCHKNLHRQQQQHNSSSSSSSVEMFAPLLDHGILRQRMLDLLTDTFRAQLLQLVGYKTDVVEFVSGEHTPRNLLIRAVKQRRPQQQQHVREANKQLKLAQQYEQLKDYWGVTPYLEKLLRQDGLLPQQLT